MAYREQTTNELYNTLSHDERFMVDELIYGKKEISSAKRKFSLKYSDEDDKTLTCTDGSCRSLQDYAFQSLASEDDYEKDASKHSENLNDKQDLCEEDDGLLMVQSNEQDFETVSRRLSSLPSVCLVDELQELSCDQIEPFNSLTVEAAMERLGLEDKYSVGFTDSKRRASWARTPSDLSIEASYKKRKQIPSADRVKCYLRGLKGAPQPPRPPKSPVGIVKAVSSRFKTPKSLGKTTQIVEIANVIATLRTQEPTNKPNLVRKQGSQINKGQSDSHQHQHQDSIHALFKLTQNPENATEFANSCGIPLLLETMERNSRNATLQRNAIGTLLHVSLACPEYVLAQQHLSSLLMTVMRQHPGCISLLNTALILLQRLASLDDQECTDAMVNSNVVSVIFDILKAHPRNSQLVHNGLATLTWVCNRRLEARHAVTTSGNLIILVKITKSYESNVAIHRQAFKLLRSLKSVSSDRFPSYLVKDKAVATIMTRAGLINKVPNVKSG